MPSMYTGSNEMSKLLVDSQILKISIFPYILQSTIGKLLVRRSHLWYAATPRSTTLLQKQYAYSSQYAYYAHTRGIMHNIINHMHSIIYITSILYYIMHTTHLDYAYQLQNQLVVHNMHTSSYSYYSLEYAQLRISATTLEQQQYCMHGTSG